MKIIVYTALAGPKSTVQPSTWVRSGRDNQPIQYLCFTDQPAAAVPAPWQVQPLEKFHTDPARNAKRYKVLPHELLPNHDVNIWVDANFRITRGYDDLVQLLGGQAQTQELKNPAPEFLSSGFDPDMVLFRHFERSCLYDEAEVCKAMGLDSREIIEAQMKRYRKMGFPTQYGLGECGCLVRRNTCDMAELMETWWREICGGSRRDQLSFMYSVWVRSGRDKVRILDRTSRDGYYHEWTPHREMGPLLKV